MDTCRRWSHTIDDLKSLRKVDDDYHEREASKKARTVDTVSNIYRQYGKRTYANVAAMTRWESILMGKIGNNLVLLPRPVNQVSHTAKAVQKIPEATMRKMTKILLQG